MVPVRFHSRQAPSVANQHLYFTEVSLEKKSLINLCLDLVESDPDSEAEMVVFEEKIKSLSTKIDSYVFLDKYADSQIEMLKKEREFISRQINAYDRLQDRLRSVAIMALNSTGQKKMKSDSGHGFYLRKSHSVQIINVNRLPAWAVEVRVEKVANRTKLKDALISGEIVDGAELIEKEHVILK